MDDDANDDEEDWYDDENELDDADDESTDCPECGRELSGYCDKCNHCGYWLTPADRRRLRPDDTRPMWQRMTAVILIAVLLFLLLGALSWF
jgi:hypothetical protein